MLILSKLILRVNKNEAIKERIGEIFEQSGAVAAMLRALKHRSSEKITIMAVVDGFISFISGQEELEGENDDWASMYTKANMLAQKDGFSALVKAYRKSIAEAEEDAAVRCLSLFSLLAVISDYEHDYNVQFPDEYCSAPLRAVEGVDGIRQIMRSMRNHPQFYAHTLEVFAFIEVAVRWVDKLTTFAAIDAVLENNSFDENHPVLLLLREKAAHAKKLIRGRKASMGIYTTTSVAAKLTTWAHHSKGTAIISFSQYISMLKYAL
jgi:hypothetical protein